MVDPGTAMIIAQAIASAAKAGGDFLGGKTQEKQAKRRARETERETHANLMDEALNRNAELEAHKLASRNRLSKSKARTSQETADLVRGALSI